MRRNFVNLETPQPCPIGRVVEALEAASIVYRRRGDTVEIDAKDFERAIEAVLAIPPRMKLVEHIRQQIALDPARYANNAKLRAIVDKIVREVSPDEPRL